MSAPLRKRTCANSARLYLLCAISGREQMQQAAPLLNHVIGTSHQRRRQVEAERLGGFEVDRQLDPGRELDRQIARLGALQNPVDVAGPTPIALSLVDAVGCEQAGL